MRKRYPEVGFGLAAVLVCWVAAGCGNGSSDRPPPAGFVPAPGGSGGTGGTSSKAGRGGAGRGGSGQAGDGSSGQAGDDTGGNASGASGGKGGKGGKGGSSQGGHAGDGTHQGANGGGGNETAAGGALIGGPDLDCPDVTPGSSSTEPVCDPKATWGQGEGVLPNPTGADAVLAITPDELTIVWRTADSFGSSVSGADRSDPGAKFGDAYVIADPSGTPPTQVALSATRLRLVAVLSGHFIEFARGTTDEPFTYGGTGNYALIEADAGFKALMLADPVLGADGTTLYYTGQPATLADPPTLYLSTRTGTEDWPVGTAVDECELAGVSTGGRRPTGLSADLRTLFYYDEPRGAMRAAWRTAPDAPFDTFVDLGAHLDARPNAACDRLYYSAMTDDMGLAVYAAEPE